MKIIIDPYRGGTDTGENISGKYEKNILLELSQYMAKKLKEAGIDSEIIRTDDINLTDNERNSIINELKNKDDIIIQNRKDTEGLFEIIYPLRNSDTLASLISNNLENNNINVSKYYQRRLPSDTLLDYYSVIRNTSPNETLIIEYNNLPNYQKSIDIIVNTLKDYLEKKNTYKVVAGDTLYKIANKFGVTVDELKKANNLTNNNLSIGTILKIISPVAKEEKEESTNNLSNVYTVKKGDTLYSIAKIYGVSVNEIKNLNNLTSNLLSINQQLKIPTNNKTYLEYTIKKGDTLYSIAKTYGVSVNEIKNLNNLTSNLLSINQILKIPKK